MSDTLKSGDLVELVREISIQQNGKKLLYEEGTEFRYIRPGPEKDTSELFDGSHNIVRIPNDAFEKIEEF